jgi:hypothetical protein
MELKLGRKLRLDETVDHIDGDFKNNDLTNLQILSRSENASKFFDDNPDRRARKHSFTCPFCLKESEILYSVYKRNQLVLGKAGPYCSKQCAGKVHH